MSKKPLSASRIKTLQSCSWYYWCNYHLKLPQKTYAGTTMGSACHNVFEFLGNPKRKSLYKTIIDADSITASPAIVRYVSSFIKKRGLDPFDVVETTGSSAVAIEHIDKMIMEGLRYDFYGSDCDEDEVELEFNLDVNEDGLNYRIRGFIDRLFIFKQEYRALIRDFKSGKRKFSGKDIDDNVQDLIYQIAVRRLYPDITDTNTEFVFLQFPDNLVLETPKVSELELRGFEYFLTEVQGLIDNFSLSDAKANFAADKGFVPSYEGFGGLIKCGVFPKLSCDTPFDKKASGEPLWHCEFKFAKYYYVLLDKEGKILQSENEPDLLKPNKKNGEVIEKRFYEGCPRFQNLPYNQEINKKHLTNTK